MPRCRSLPHSSRHTALPTAAPGSPAVPVPHHLPLPSGCQKGAPLGRGSGSFTMWQNPQQGAPGLSQGQTTPAQVPCPRKLEGHVSTPGVTPDMHPCTAAPLSTWSSLLGSLHSPATSYRSFCRCHHWTGLTWNPWQGTGAGAVAARAQGVPHLFVQIHEALSTTAARRAPSSAVWGVEPGTGSRAAAG